MKRYQYLLFAVLILTLGVRPTTSFGEIIDIQITSPHPNATFHAGDDIVIEWVLDTQYSVDIYIALDKKNESGDPIYLTPSGGVNNTGSYSAGSIPAFIESGFYDLSVRGRHYSERYIGTVPIRVIGQKIEITAPQNGHRYQPGEDLIINWNSTVTNQEKINVWLKSIVTGEDRLDLTPPGGVADNGAYSWVIPDNFDMGRYVLGVETADHVIDDAVEIIVMALDARMGEQLKRFIPHVDRPRTGEKFADFCQQDDTWGPLYHSYYTVSIGNNLKDIEVDLWKMSQNGNSSIRWQIDPIIGKAELISGPGYTGAYHATKHLCLPQGFYKIKASRYTGNDYLTRRWSQWIFFYVAQDPKLIGDGPVPDAVKEIGCREFILESPKVGKAYVSALTVPIKVRSPVANPNPAGTSVHVQLGRKVPGSNDQWENQFKVWMVKTSDMTNMINCWTWQTDFALEPGDYYIIAALDSAIFNDQDVVTSGRVEFSVKTVAVDAGQLPALKDLSSSAQMQFGASKTAFNLKDKAVFTVPEADTKLQFQHREGNMWRMVAAPQMLGSRKVTGVEGTVFRREYRFQDPGKYRYRIKDKALKYPWQKFEIKGDKKKGQRAAVRPKTTRALVPAVKPSEGGGSPGKGRTVQPDTVKPPRISSLRTGKTFSADDPIKLKAEYNRSHKITFVLQRKHGNSYKTLKKTGHGGLGKLDPGAYRVGVVYAGGQALPDKWIKFNVAKAKKLKAPPPAYKKLNPDKKSIKKPTIDLN